MIQKILLMENNFKIFKSDVSDFIGVFDTDFKGKEFIDYFKFLKQTNNTFRSFIRWH
jgi:hypothetical protein